MKRRIQNLIQLAIMLVVFIMMMPTLKAQTNGTKIRVGTDSTISYWNGSAWINIAPGLSGQSLRFTNGVPSWIWINNPQMPVHDIDGNGYDTVKIGSQIWFKQNLKTTKYSNGNPIPDITDGMTWLNLTSGGRCYYNYNHNNIDIYGLLYNFFAVSNAGNLCPIG